MAEPIQIEGWSTAFANRDPYKSPEACGICLQGHIKGGAHPRFPVSGMVFTTPIVAVEGRLVTTESGSVYRLGEPDEKFAKWNEERGKPLDPERPILNGAWR